MSGWRERKSFVKQKYRKYVVLAVIALNLIAVGSTIRSILKFHDVWDKENLSPEVRLVYGDKLLHVIYYEILPADMSVMIISVIGIWILRK